MKRKDKTGSTIVEEITMRESEEHNGAYVFADSVSDRTPDGVQLLLQDAMCLSSFYFTPKDGNGTRPELYEAFESEYVDNVGDEEEKEKPVVVRMTAAEKEEERLEKKRVKEEEMAEKKAEKERIAEEKRAEKERAEEMKRLAASMSMKTSSRVVMKKTVVPKTVVEDSVSSLPAVSPVKSSVVVKKAVVPNAVPVAIPVKRVLKSAAKVQDEAVVSVGVMEVMEVEVEEMKVDTWLRDECPDDGSCIPWTFKGKKYLRNMNNEVWINSDESYGDWMGKFDFATDAIVACDEPLFDD